MYTNVATDDTRFVWDDAKRLTNLAKHRLDLTRGITLLQEGVIFTYSSRRDDEDRFVSIGLLDDVFVALVWMERDGSIRLISLRSARDAEKRKYRQRYG